VLIETASLLVSLKKLLLVVSVKYKNCFCHDQNSGDNDVAARGHLLAHRQQEFRARVNEFLMDHDVVLLAI